MAAVRAWAGGDPMTGTPLDAAGFTTVLFKPNDESSFVP